MAKQSLFGSGKNSIQQTGHITSRKVSNSSGFSSQKSLGADTSPGSGPGAPFKDADRKDDSNVRRSNYPRGGNPYNPHDTNEQGVLGVNLSATDATQDSPVPAGATRSHTNLPALKLSDASAIPGTLDRFPADGVLGKT